MSVYKFRLPEVFPHCVRATPDDVRQWVAFLLDKDRKDVPQGSSFAVTVDNWDGTWNLWLSRVSLNALQDEFNHDTTLQKAVTTSARGGE